MLCRLWAPSPISRKRDKQNPESQPVGKKNHQRLHVEYSGGGFPQWTIRIQHFCCCGKKTGEGTVREGHGAWECSRDQGLANCSLFWLSCGLSAFGGLCYNHRSSGLECPSGPYCLSGLRLCVLQCATQVMGQADAPWATPLGQGHSLQT